MLFAVMLWALAFVLATTTYAEAGFVTAALFGSAFAASFVGKLVTLAFTVAANIGLSLLAKALRKTDEPPPQGVRFEVEVGDDHPIGFVVGDYATSGTRKYINTWGRVGKTPNAYLVDVLQLGDLPAPGQPQMWLNGEWCTILWGEPHAEFGFPVQNFRQGSTDHLWIRYLDGTQTGADSYLSSRFGSDPVRPWTSDMIGRGMPIAIVTALSNRELFPGQLQFLFQPPPVRFYDVRKDSTAGGSGAHRWSTPSTWEATNNPMVIAYNLIRGVYYGNPGSGEWLFGGQDLPAFRLPASSWIAAMNACDATIVADGVSEPMFRAGYEVRGDMEPLAVIEELLKACTGRMAEVGGIFKPLVGIPGTAVFAFTDADILVNHPQQFEPFPRLEQTHNAIEATYPEPFEAWSTKDAPALFDSALEASDGNRRLPAGVSLPAAPYGYQVQRIMRAMLMEERRFRTHGFHLPPDAWLLEPNDLVSWTSPRNGYSNKLFLVVEITGERSINQRVVLKEVDPSDYDWQGEFEQPIAIGPIGPVRAPAQGINDWFAEGVEITGANGTVRPGIRLEWDGDVEDVIGVEWQVRRASDAVVILTGRTERVEAGEAYISQSLFSATDYQVLGRYIPGTPRPTLWSDWLNVTTPNSPLNDIATELRSLQAEVKDLFKDIIRRHDEFVATSLRVYSDVSARNVADVTDRRIVEKTVTFLEQGLDAQVSAFQELSGTVIQQGDLIIANANSITATNAQIETIDGTIEGQALTLSELQSTVTALGNDIESVAELTNAAIALSEAGTASGLFNVRAVSGPGGASVELRFEGRLSTNSGAQFGGGYLRVSPSGADWVFSATRFIITDATGSLDFAPFAVIDGVVVMMATRVNEITAGLLRSPDNKFRLTLTSGALEWWD